MTTALQQYIDLYDQHRAAIESHAPAALNALRPTARKALDGAVLPRKGDDDYEATDLERLLAPDYGVNVNRIPFDAGTSHPFNCDVPNMSTCLRFLL